MTTYRGIFGYTNKAESIFTSFIKEDYSLSAQSGLHEMFNYSFYLPLDDLFNLMSCLLSTFKALLTRYQYESRCK